MPPGDPGPRGVVIGEIHAKTVNFFQGSRRWTIALVTIVAIAALVTIVATYNRPLEDRDFAGEIADSIVKDIKNPQIGDEYPKEPIWESAFHKAAKKHNISEDELLRRVNRWVESTELNEQSSLNDRGLAAFLQRNFSESANLYQKAANAEKSQLEKLTADAESKKRDVFELDTKIGDSDLAGDHLLEALAAYEDSTQYVAYPSRNWARAKVNTAIAHHELGDQLTDSTAKGHLEQSVNDFRLALEIFTNSSPPDWANTMNDLGQVLVDEAVRCSDSAALDFFSDAIACHKSALQIYDKTNSSNEWAKTMDLLGFAIQRELFQLDITNRSELLASAIEAHREATKTLSKDSSDYDWAAAQINLGMALTTRAEDDNGTNSVSTLTEAIQALKSALEVFTKDDFPYDWARTQNRLGNALTDKAERETGTSADELFAAGVQAYNSAAQDEVKKRWPDLWAKLKYNLTMSFAHRGESEKGELALSMYSKAADAARDALTVYSLNLFPQEWAETERYLGNALYNEANHSSADQKVTFFGKAAEAYRTTLQYYTKERFLSEWAQSQDDLGDALYQESLAADGTLQAKLATQAAQAYRNSLEGYDRQDSPDDWSGVQEQLGNALYIQGLHSIASDAAAPYGDAENAYKSALSLASGNNFALLQTELAKTLMAHANCVPLNEAAILRSRGIEAYRAAANQGDVEALNSLAWFLSTSRDDTIRDGRSAVYFAEKAVNSVRSPVYLDTLAAAYAETGQFEKAVTSENEAISLLSKNDIKLGDWALRLKSYELGRPFRDTQ